MRVVLDGYWWHGGPVALRRTVIGIVSAWNESFPSDELWVVTRTRPSTDGPFMPDGVVEVGTRVWPQALSAHLQVPRVGRRVRADVVLTQNFAPLLGPGAVFVHDYLFVDHPEWFTPAERMYFRSMVVTPRRVTTVFTSSSAEAERIRSHSRQGVRVVPVGLGIDDLLVTPPTKPAWATGAVHAGRFLLSVGRINVRKNLAALLRGAAMSRSVGPEMPLIVVGEADGRAADLGEEVDALIASGAVHFVGGVSDAELRWLYDNCTLFVYLSLGEGFGLPPVEAAACGARLLLSDLPVFRETSSDAAMFTDPFDPRAIGTDIDRALAAPPNHAAATSASYRWRRVVEGIRGTLDDGDPR